MLYYHTEAQRQMLREHAEQLAREMRRNSDPTTADVGRERRTWQVTGFLLGVRRALRGFALTSTTAKELERDRHAASAGPRRLDTPSGKAEHRLSEPSELAVCWTGGAKPLTYGHRRPGRSKA
jgi:hypothetical protein